MTHSNARIDDFTAVVTRYQSLLWSIAYSITGDKALSDDVTQEAFLAVWKQQADIRDMAKLKGYLATIVRNLAKKAIRGTGREVMNNDGLEETPENAQGPLDDVLQREENLQITAALQQMPQSSREAFVLFYSDGQSVAGVAEQLELSPSAVKQRLYRARENLKDSLSSTLSRYIQSARPGKTFTATTMAFILAKSSASAVAVGLGELPASQTVVQAQGLSKSTTLLSNKAVGVLLIVGVAVVALLWQATMSVDESEQSSESARLKPATVSQALQPADRVEPMPDRARPANSFRLQAQVPEKPISGPELLTNRLMKYLPDADLNHDGRFSEDEILAVRELQEDELTKQLIEHWQDEPCGGDVEEVHPLYGVTCAFVVTTDTGQEQEGYSPYNIYRIRELYEEAEESGQDMDETQWVASMVADTNKDRICYEILVAEHDQVHKLRTEARGQPLLWVAGFSADGEDLRFPPPPRLSTELSSVTSEFEASEVSAQWGIELLVRTDDNDNHDSNGPHYIAISQPTSGFAEWDELPPSMQLAIETARDSIQQKD